MPSNIDFACNAIGALAGAVLGMNWGQTLADACCCWPVAAHPAQPGNPALRHRDLRTLLGLEALSYSAGRFIVIEAGVAMAGVLAAGLVAASLMKRANPGCSPSWPC